LKYYINSIPVKFNVNYKNLFSIILEDLGFNIINTSSTGIETNKTNNRIAHEYQLKQNYSKLIEEATQGLDKLLCDGYPLSDFYIDNENNV
jgi:hypothetical protein